MPAKLLVDIPMNWAYTVLLEPGKKYVAGSTTDNAIRVPDAKTSVRHAEFFDQSDNWFVRDLKSEHGTIVNGAIISTDTALTNGDLLKLGNCDLVYQCTQKKAAEENWTKTRGFVSERQGRLLGAIRQGDHSSELLKAINVGNESSVQMPAIEPEAKTPTEPASVHGTDLLWVARQLSDILDEVLAHPGTPDEIFGLMLKRLKVAIKADNGFLMIPSEDKKRWVIRAWVGAVSDWTDYEKSHPVSLTVANKAFAEGRIVSNALRGDEAPDEIDSKSLQMMAVHCYLAVPLIEKGENRGVLYFDTRKTIKMFEPREAKLIERAGAYILEIDKPRA
ncbi:MAG: FHA domain-containing protein [Candidatus Sumerlaeaceae bacterium]|nr:FHA domain-containing protein [Candidatus Sumerlaeaceae bacterium]